jgi:NAD(P)-dependent dehydrogenase (short-subunit alcohol dehydrogenase family)
MDATMADWDRALSVNLKGEILCSRSVVPHMQARGKGAIVNISSVHSFQTVNGVAPYATSKGGVYALTHAMAIDLAPAIRVNAIAPGWIYTPLIQSIFDSYADPAAQRKEIERRAIMKRIGIPEEVVAAFLEATRPFHHPPVVRRWFHRPTRKLWRRWLECQTSREEPPLDPK